MPPPLAAPSPSADSRDRREGGRWTLGQAVKNHLLYGVVRLVLLALRPLPTGWLVLLGRALGRAAYRARVSRRVARENLARAFPHLRVDEREALALRAYGRLGGYLGQTVAQLQGTGRAVPLAFEEGSRAILEEACREGRGVVFASAHLGPWEHVAASLVHHGFPLTTLARESYDPRFLGLYETLRRRAGVKAIYRGSPSAPIRIVRTLRRGELLGVPMDLRSRVPSRPVPFLGAPASTPVGPARIALRTGATVVVGTAIPAESAADGLQGGGLLVRVTRVETRDLETGEAGEAELLVRLNDELSRRIRAFPEGWVWMHPRWDHADGEISAPSSKETRYTSSTLAEGLR